MLTKKDIQEELKTKGVQFDENTTMQDLRKLLKENSPEEEIKTTEEKTTVEIKEEEEKTIQIKESDWQRVQDQLKMLYDVADKGRVFNYENRKTQDKKALKVKLSVYNGGVIIGWRTLKDELVKNPTTGRTVGEIQQYEVKFLNKEGQINSMIIDGYVNFSNARYSERIEAQVIGRKETWDGNQTFEVLLPDGRTVSLDSRFVN